MYGKRFPLALAVFALAGLTAAAQIPVPDSAQPPNAKKVPEAMGKPLALPVSGESKLVVGVIPSADMSAEDQQLFASSQPEIRRRAAAELMPLDQAGWSIEQLACPAFPHWLLLRYTQGSAPGTRSLFSVAIGRQERQIRIMPLVRKGYSASGSASGNPILIGALNAMIGGENPKPPLSQIGLCYAALTGAAAQKGDGGKLLIRPAESPTVRVEQSGEESITVVAGEISSPGLSLDFDRHGKLVKAARLPSAVLVSKPMHISEEPQKGRPVPAQKQK